MQWEGGDRQQAPESNAPPIGYTQIPEAGNTDIQMPTFSMRLVNVCPCRSSQTLHRIVARTKQQGTADVDGKMPPQRYPRLLITVTFEDGHCTGL